MTGDHLDPDLIPWNPELSEAEKAYLDEMRPTIEPQIKMMQQLRELFEMSPSEFQQFLFLDEDADLPPGVPRQSLTLTKLLSAVASKGGTLTLEIQINGTVTRIPE